MKILHEVKVYKSKRLSTVVEKKIINVLPANISALPSDTFCLASRALQGMLGLWGCLGSN